ECRAVNPDILLIKADVAQKTQVEMLFRKGVETFGAIDVLVNNAGLNIDKSLHDLTEEDWDKVVDTNMKGVFLCSQIASKYMLEQEAGGIILNIGATTGIGGRTQGINYCASKAGVLVMTKCLALELAPKVRVNCIIPGFTRTPETETRFQLAHPQNLEFKARSIPLGRIGTPEDIAEAVSFMLSDGAKYITGQKIIVDGGQFMY
ncbi:MAG TPA: SDR family NAD(P)-dependent oxidoreductase, partial [Ktedonobacteraceae bacterium]|nr:SDR family NAD(P)-dependent oxidoreductase [Ktedonobacteraceae bacterium]